MSNIWELAKQRVQEPVRKIGVDVQLDENGKPLVQEGTDDKTTVRPDVRKQNESYVIVCGSKDSGKTSLILRFLDRDEPTKPTIALEYTYGRRTRGNNKDVGHIWELGGGPFLANLLEIPIVARNLEISSMILMLDLSQPDELWHTTTLLLEAARRRIEKIMTELKTNDAGAYNRLQNSAWMRVGATHQDKDMIKPFPIPLAIVGAKYDIFQDIDSEKKKAMCKTLRFLAHTNGASLQFYSSKIENLVIRGRALMSHLVFDTNPSKGLSVDYNKPLFVPAGGDSLAEIGAPPLADQSLGSIHVSKPLELWKTAFNSYFPQKEAKMEIRDDPARDPQYKEDVIDKLREQKDQELERYIRQKGERREVTEKENRLTVENTAPAVASPIQSPRSPPPEPQHPEE
uniref:Cytoplasmic dynein 2 light intermediate chain 1 n=1 Tax=Plectus sambesii TaxID=2011161 RepID=A0A914VYB5_9BILA